jgi:hypothetical protein
MKLFYIYNSNADDILDMSEITNVMLALKIPLNEQVYRAISYISPGLPVRITKLQFQRLMMLVDCKPELEELFNSYCDHQQSRIMTTRI